MTVLICLTDQILFWLTWFMGINCPNHVGSTRNWGGGCRQKKGNSWKKLSNLSFWVLFTIRNDIWLSLLYQLRGPLTLKKRQSARFATRFDTRVSSRHHWEAENEISNSLEMAFSLWDLRLFKSFWWYARTHQWSIFGVTMLNELHIAGTPILHAPGPPWRKWTAEILGILQLLVWITSTCWTEISSSRRVYAKYYLIFTGVPSFVEKTSVARNQRTISFS